SSPLLLHVYTCAASSTKSGVECYRIGGNISGYKIAIKSCRACFAFSPRRSLYGGMLGCVCGVSQRRVTRRCYRQPINLYTATYEMMVSVRLLCLVFRARGRLSSDVSSAACVASRRRTVKIVYEYG
ncbi:unnamed protein product, partial [Pylaiella littoralis]